MRRGSRKYNRAQEFLMKLGEAGDALAVGAVMEFRATSPRLTEAEFVHFNNCQHADGSAPLKRLQANARDTILTHSDSFHPSVVFDMVDLWTTMGDEGKQRTIEFMKKCFRMAAVATLFEGVHSRMGAGGRTSVEGVPLVVGALHLFTDNGGPGPHVHRLEHEVAHVPGVGWRTMDKATSESRFATAEAFTKAWHEAAAKIAPAYLGVQLTTEAGRAVDKRVDMLMHREIGVGSRREDMIGWCLEKGVEANHHWMNIANIATREKEPQATTLAEKLPELKEACDRAKAGYEQRTGQRFYGPDPERMKPLEELQAYGAKRDKDVGEITRAVGQSIIERQGDVIKAALEKERRPQRQARMEARAEGLTIDPKPEKPAQEKEPEVKPEPKKPTKAQETKADGPTVEEPRAKPEPKAPEPGEKIDLNTYQQPKKEDPKPQPKAEPQQAQQDPKPQQAAKPDPTRGPEGESQWAKHRKSRAEQRAENLREEFLRDMGKPLLWKLGQEVKTAVKTAAMVRQARKLGGRDRHTITSREGLEKFVVGTSKTPRWMARREAHRAIRRNFFKMAPHDLAAHAKDVFREARKPSIALKKGDRINVQKAVGDTLTKKELADLVKVAKKSRATLFVPGREAEIRNLALRWQRQQRGQRQRRGQNHSH